MPWTKKDFPDSMKNLTAPVRNKAIEIANALVEDEKMKEGIAIATAISRAKDWAANQGKKTKNKAGSRVTDQKVHGKDVYVIPEEDRWALKIEGENGDLRTYKTKRKAVRKGRKKAKSVNGTLTVQKRSGRIQMRISYNPNKQEPKKSTRRRAAATA